MEKYRFPFLRARFLTGLLSGILLLVAGQNCRNPTGPEQVQLAADSLPVYPVSLSPNTCRPCHKAIVDSFLLTGKGRSFLPLSRLADAGIRPGLPVYDSLRDLYYRPIPSDSAFWVEEFRLEGADTIHYRREKAGYMIGSGNQTRSFLFSRHGYLYEMPLTWYRKKGIWDLSPGYENGGNQRFSREIGVECLSCHVSGFQPVPHSLNRYTETGTALTCESCHGPMKEHAGRAGKGGKDPHVLRLGSLTLQARLDVCRQCHLEGIRVRKKSARPGFYAPGKLLSDYDEVFIPSAGKSEFGFASHAERLQLSRCFTLSKGRLQCISCHNPHNPIRPGQSPDATCCSCHGGKAHEKSCPVAGITGGSCTGCHMQKNGTSDIPHVRSTDHWIRRRPAQPSEVPGGRFGTFLNPAATRADKGKALLVWAASYSGPEALHEAEAYLDSLSATDQLTFHYLNGTFPPSGTDTLAFSRSTDPLVHVYWAEVKKRRGLPWTGDLEEAVRLAPVRIDFQYRLAQARFLGQGNPVAFDPVLALNPFHPQALTSLGFVALEGGNYPKAEDFFRRALREDPDYVLAQENLARCYMQWGRFAECRKLLSRLTRRFPGESRYRTLLQTLP